MEHYVSFYMQFLRNYKQFQKVIDSKAGWITRLKANGFKDLYFISKLPKYFNNQGLNGSSVYLRIADLAYILSRHSKEFPIIPYSKLKEVIEDYDLLLKGTRSNSNFIFVKKYTDDDNNHFLVDVAIDRYVSENKNEFIVHLNYKGKHRYKNTFKHLLNSSNLLDNKLC